MPDPGIQTQAHEVLAVGLDQAGDARHPAGRPAAPVVRIAVGADHEHAARHADVARIEPAAGIAARLPRTRATSMLRGFAGEVVGEHVPPAREVAVGIGSRFPRHDSLCPHVVNAHGVGTSLGRCRTATGQHEHERG